MQGITSSTKLLMRLATFIAAIVALVCLGLAIFVLINKLINWDTYPVGRGIHDRRHLLPRRGPALLHRRARRVHPQHQQPHHRQAARGRRRAGQPRPAPRLPRLARRPTRHPTSVVETPTDETARAPADDGIGERRARDPRAQRIRRLAWQFARFLVVGLISFAFDYGLFFVLFHYVRRAVHRREHRSRSRCRSCSTTSSRSDSSSRRSRGATSRKSSRSTSG